MFHLKQCSVLHKKLVTPTKSGDALRDEIKTIMGPILLTRYDGH